jgi:ABC-type lipoprotein release transport system permease subunit
MAAILRESYLLKTGHLANKLEYQSHEYSLKIILFISIIGSKAVIFYGSSLMESSQKEVRSSVLKVFRVGP